MKKKFCPEEMRNKILRLTEVGLSLKEIAERMGVSKYTIRDYLNQKHKKKD